MADVVARTLNVTGRLIDRHIVEARGAAPALRYGDKRYSFHDLAALMNRAGNMLKTLGLQPGQNVLLALPPSPAFVASWLGAMKIGAVPNVMDHTAPAALEDAADLVDAAAIIIHERSLAAIEGLPLSSRPVVVVGQQTGSHKSFLELMREEPSSLSAEAVRPEAAALGLLDGKSVRALTHGELADMLDGKRDAAGSPAGVLAMAAALAKGEEFALN